MLVGSRPRKSWLECVNDDMRKSLVLKKEMAHDWTVCGGRPIHAKHLNCASMENLM